MRRSHCYYECGAVVGGVQICSSLSLQTLVQNVPRCDVMCCDVQCCAVLCCVVFRRAVYPQVRKDPPQAPRGCSNATRQASQSELGPALQSLFSRGQGTEAQWHKGITALSLQSKQPRNLNATKQHRQQTFGNSIYRFSSGTERSLEMACIHNKCAQRSLQ